MKSSQRPKTSSQRSRRLRLVVNAGPTREYFDSVRFLSNPSTGKMGYAIAMAAAKRGHDVTLITGPVALRAPKGIKTLAVTTAAEMARSTKQAFRTADAAILTAAVCDYRPRRQACQKAAKSTRCKSVILVPTEDIAAALGRRKGHRVTIAFALEDHAARQKAEQKLLHKNCDAIVLNGPENVGMDRARVQVLIRGGRWQRWPEATKQQVALRLIKIAEQLISSKTAAE